MDGRGRFVGACPLISTQSASFASAELEIHTYGFVGTFVVYCARRDGAHFETAVIIPMWPLRTSAVSRLDWAPADVGVV